MRYRLSIKRIMSTHPTQFIALALILVFLAFFANKQNSKAVNRDGRLFLNTMNDKVVQAEYAVRGEVSSKKNKK